MLFQFVRSFRDAVMLQIARTGAQPGAGGAYRPGNHARVRQLSDSNCNVESGVAQVRVPLLHIDLDPEVRILSGELGKRRRGNAFAEVSGNGDPERAPDISVESCNEIVGSLDRLQDLDAPGVVDRADFGRCDASRRAIDSSWRSGHATTRSTGPFETHRGARSRAPA